MIKNKRYCDKCGTMIYNRSKSAKYCKNCYDYIEGCDMCFTIFSKDEPVYCRKRTEKNTAKAERVYPNSATVASF